MSPYQDYGEYGRCEATAKSTGQRCGRAAVGDHGKCDLHGGNSESGEDHPQFKHGLFSDHLSEEDRKTIKALDEYDDDEKLDELINWRLARLRRYLRRMDEAERESFFDKFDRMVREGARNGDPGLSAKQIKELGRTLNQNDRAAQQEIDLIRKLIKDRNKIAEGEDVNLGWREALAGGDDS